MVQKLKHVTEQTAMTTQQGGPFENVGRNEFNISDNNITNSGAYDSRGKRERCAPHKRGGGGCSPEPGPGCPVADCTRPHPHPRARDRNHVYEFIMFILL